MPWLPRGPGAQLEGVALTEGLGPVARAGREHHGSGVSAPPCAEGWQGTVAVLADFAGCMQDEPEQKLLGRHST